MGCLAPARRWPVTAVAWKQFCETGNVALIGAICVLGACLLAVLIQLQEQYFQPHRRSPVDAEALVAIAVVFGFGLALVAGIGTLLFDLRPGLNGFWRSRPINTDLWFWVKYSVALSLVLSVALLPLVIYANSQSWNGDVNARDAYIIAMTAAYLAVFAAAAAMTSLVRQAVYAAILSVAFLYFGMASVWLALVIAAQRGGWKVELPSDPTALSASQTAIAMLINFVVGTLIAWLAVRYDWGRKSRN
jgi:hypothetical protein